VLVISAELKTMQAYLMVALKPCVAGQIMAKSREHCGEPAGIVGANERRAAEVALPCKSERQKEKVAERSKRRLAVPDENGPPARPVDFPNVVDERFPTGRPGFHVLNRLRAIAAMVRL